MARIVLAGADAQEDGPNGKVNSRETHAKLQFWSRPQEGLAESLSISHATVWRSQGTSRRCWASGGCGDLWSYRQES